MSYVSGVATASGVSSFLSAPRDASLALRQSVGEAAPNAALRRAEPDTAPAPSKPIAVRPVTETGQAERAVPRSRESADPRYTQFIDAVTALRVDFAEANLTRSRVAELRAAAKEVFKMDDGIPGEVKPDIPTPESRAADARAEAAAQAERQRQADAKNAEADRLEIAQQRAEARAADTRRLAETPPETKVQTEKTEAAVAQQPAEVRARTPEPADAPAAQQPKQDQAPQFTPAKAPPPAAPTGAPAPNPAPSVAVADTAPKPPASPQASATPAPAEASGPAVPAPSTPAPSAPAPTPSASAAPASATPAPAAPAPTEAPAGSA